MQSQLLATSFMRGPLLFATAFLATQSVELAANIAFLAWLLLDVGLNEAAATASNRPFSSGPNILMPDSRTIHTRVHQYRTSKRKLHAAGTRFQKFSL
jgi:hypothetical protein